MSVVRVITLGLAAALALTAGAQAMTLEEAIAAAQRTNPTLAQSRDEVDAAKARLLQAHAAALPSVTLSGRASGGSDDLHGFFGFGRSTVYPADVSLELRQPLYAGGGISAGIDRAREARDAAVLQAEGAKALLAVQVAEAYIDVQSAREAARLGDAQMRELSEVASQAQRRFDDGEVPRTDLAEAQARLAQARAGQAQAVGEVARAEAHFQSVVGVAPDALDAAAAPALSAATLAVAVAKASDASPTLLAARASLRSAEAAVRAAQAERLPSAALTLSAGATRDEFLPGYRNDAVAVGVEGRWTLFSGGAVSGRIDEARAGRRAAQDALDAAQAQVRDAVVDAWEDTQVARSAAEAAADQASAEASARDSVAQEVRVGQKPTLDLLNAEQEALAADVGLVRAKGAVVVSAYRLNALLGER